MQHIYRNLILILLLLFSLNQHIVLSQNILKDMPWELPNGDRINITWTDTILTNSLSLYGFVSNDYSSTVTYTNYKNAIEISIESPLHGTYYYNNSKKRFEPINYNTDENDGLISETTEIENDLKSVFADETDTLPIVDVLFVFTKETRIALGGLDQVIAKAKQSVQNSNNVFKSSKINTQIRLVQVAEIDYRTGSVLSKELGYLRNKTDGKMDEIHEMRDKAGADVVCLLTDKDIQTTRGMAYILSSENGKPSDAFTVNYYSTAHGVFPHEIGHTLGCNHNIERGGPSLYYNSFGHHFIHKGETRGSMMSYIGKRCARFAGPNTFWEGTVTGVDSIANTVATINKSGYIVAKYRKSKTIIDASVNMDTISKDTLQCTLSNKYPNASSSLDLFIDLPQKATIKDISVNEYLHLTGNMIRIDSLKANETKKFTIILNMDSVTINDYKISSTLKNASDKQVDFNPANNAHTLNISLPVQTNNTAIKSISETREIRVQNQSFTNETYIEVAQLTLICIYDTNGKMLINTEINESQSIGRELPKGIYILKAVSSRGARTFKIIKY